MTPLTPIHIGTGDEIDPLEYVMLARKDGGKRLYRLNLPAMIESFTPSRRTEFLKLLDGADMVALRKFVSDNAIPVQHGFYSAVVNDPVYETYQERRFDRNNALRIDPMYRRLDTWQAVIPGSSIKGAIRTAVLSHELKDAYQRDGWLPDTHSRGWEWKWENEVLNATKPNDDPFRTICLEDVTLPADAIIVAETKIISRNHLKANSAPEGIQQFYEMTFAYLMGEEDIVGAGSLTLHHGLRPEYDKKFNIKMLEIDIEKIVNYCKKFYRARMQEEHEKFYQTRKGEEVCTVSEQLRDVSYGNLEFPIRLGHFSHCESVTTDLVLESGEPLRTPITRRGRNGQPLPYGTTRTLAFGDFPMGWAKISLDEM